VPNIRKDTVQHQVTNYKDFRHARTHRSAIETTNLCMNNWRITKQLRSTIHLIQPQLFRIVKKVQLQPHST